MTYNLKNLADFDGNYTAVAAGATVGGGASAGTMTNQNRSESKRGIHNPRLEVHLGPCRRQLKDQEVTTAPSLTPTRASRAGGIEIQALIGSLRFNLWGIAYPPIAPLKGRAGTIARSAPQTSRLKHQRRTGRLRKIEVVHEIPEYRLALTHVRAGVRAAVCSRVESLELVDVGAGRRRTRSATPETRVAPTTQRTQPRLRDANAAHLPQLFVLDCSLQGLATSSFRTPASLA